MVNQRQKSRDHSAGPNGAIEHSYNDIAGGLKVVGPILGVLSILGPASPQRSAITRGDTIAFFNSDTSVHYVAMGVGTVTPPTGPTNGIPLKPGDWTVLGLGDNISFVSDSALVFAYQVQDETYIKVNPNV